MHLNLSFRKHLTMKLALFGPLIGAESPGSICNCMLIQNTNFMSSLACRICSRHSSFCQKTLIHWVSFFIISVLTCQPMRPDVYYWQSWCSILCMLAHHIHIPPDQPSFTSPYKLGPRMWHPQQSGLLLGTRQNINHILSRENRIFDVGSVRVDTYWLDWLTAWLIVWDRILEWRT